MVSDLGSFDRRLNSSKTLYLKEFVCAAHSWVARLDRYDEADDEYTRCADDNDVENTVSINSPNCNLTGLVLFRHLRGSPVSRQAMPGQM
jgi:hypothetical protein